MNPPWPFEADGCRLATLWTAHHNNLSTARRAKARSHAKAPQPAAGRWTAVLLRQRCCSRHCRVTSGRDAQAWRLAPLVNAASHAPAEGRYQRSSEPGPARRVDPTSTDTVSRSQKAGSLCECKNRRITSAQRVASSVNRKVSVTLDPPRCRLPGSTPAAPPFQLDADELGMPFPPGRRLFANQKLTV